MVGSGALGQEAVGRTNDLKGSGMHLRDGDGGGERVQLQYLDEYGRQMTAKEAFRRQCYNFHGKGPGATQRAGARDRCDPRASRRVARAACAPARACEPSRLAARVAGQATPRRTKLRPYPSLRRRSPPALRAQASASWRSACASTRRSSAWPRPSRPTRPSR
jgi:hypothetical protein